MKTTCHQIPHLSLTRRALVSALLLLGLCQGMAPPSVHGAVLSWSGASGSGANWNDSANWGFAGTPANGDTLIFPGGALQLTNTNDFSSLTLSQIRFVGASGNYNIYGNAFTLTNGIAATNATGGNSISNDVSFGSADLATEVGASAGLALNGSLSGSGGLIKNGTGLLLLGGSTANTYTNKTTVNAGTLILGKTVPDSTLHGPLIIGDGIGGPNSDQVFLANNEQLADTLTPVTINSSGQFNLNGINEYFGSLSGNGNVTLGGAFPRIGLDGTSTTFSGVISGIGGTYKRGAGTLTFMGNNTYSDITEIDAGTLIINGYQPQSAVAIFAPGTLGGSGTVGTITTSGGNVAPGSSPGILSCSNVTLNATAAFKVELNGPVAGVNYDQLNVSGTNNLAGAGLTVTASFTTPVALSNEFVIINNDGVEAITGTFAGAPGGTTYDNGVGYKLLLRYNGGDGNDVSLTVIELPADMAGTIAASGNGNGAIDPNECGNLYVIITNKTASPMSGISATLTSATPGVNVTQPYSGYPDAPANGRSTNATPFQISTAPGLVCGSMITLTLTLTSASHGALTIPTTLSSGAVSLSPSRFDVSTITNVPDVGTIESTNVVSGFTGPIAKVAVSLWLNAPLDSDLSISLISPDNVIVDLSSGNGAGANFGTNCTPDGGRTTFDDSAATAITAGSPPYVGAFRPEASLAALNGGTANGNWRLRINDAFFFGNPDTLRCWSLFLYPLTCAPGGGVCDLCPNITIFGALGNGSLTQGDRLTRDGLGASCLSPKGCPGDFGVDSEPYDAHIFRNGPSDACITVTLTAPTADLMSIAYLGAFDPNNRCSNYLADSGGSTAISFPIQPLVYSFDVASNAVFVVTVNAVFGLTGPYQLSVTGGDCRPALNIASAPASSVRLDWPTWAGGYRLEGTPTLTSPGWSTVTNDPIVTGSRYAVTNSVGTGNKYYRLHKP